jgi:hypothetical protein
MAEMGNFFCGDRVAGDITLTVEITPISTHGFRILSAGEMAFLEL